jgi:hypothetical protein
MIGSRGRPHLLAALALLLAGLLQTVASAQGATCLRGAAGAPAAASADGRVAAAPAVAAAQPAAAPAHEHATQPGSDSAGIPTSLCASPALAAARAAAQATLPSAPPSPIADEAARHTVPRAHFRPPRPS